MQKAFFRRLKNKPKPKRQVSLLSFSNAIRIIAKEYNKNHWEVSARYNAHGKFKFSAYVAGFWTNDFSTPEEAIEAILKHCKVELQPVLDVAI